MDKKENLSLISPAFRHMGQIPSRYTCDGENISPSLVVSGVSSDAKSLILIMEDSDVPKNIREDGTWDHWLKFNIPVSSREIKEGEEPEGISGLTTSNKLKYGGPCPPDREHRYFFKLYSLDVMLDLQEGVSKKEIEEAMMGHIIQETLLIGLYNRQ